MLDAARWRLRLALKPKARSGQLIDDRRKIVRLRGDDERVAAALGEGCKHAPRRCIATCFMHMLIHGEQLHDGVTWLEDCAQPGVVGKIDEVYARRILDGAEDHPRGVELRLRAVNGALYQDVLPATQGLVPVLKACGNGTEKALFQRARKLLGCTADGLDPR